MRRSSRLVPTAFIVLGAAFLLLLLPSLATELDTSDYTPEPAFTLYLLGGMSSPR